MPTDKRKRRKVELSPITVPEGVGGDNFGDLIEINKRLLSRVLYAQPVCLLVTKRGEQKNAMTISWVTPLNNWGEIILSMNKSRHSACILFGQDEEQLKLLSEGDKVPISEEATLTLNVPVQGSEQLVKMIGSSTGSDINKFNSLGITLTDESPPALCHPLIAATMYCQVKFATLESGHFLIRCNVTRATVRKSYWTGDTFIASRNVPPFLSFLGSGCFGYVTSDGNPAGRKEIDNNENDTSTT